MADIQSVIEQTLFDHLETMTLPTGVEIAWPNVNFTPDTKKPYLRVQVFRNVPVDIRISYGKEPIRQGILQVSVYSKTGKGTIKGAQIAGDIEEHFKRGTKLPLGALNVLIMTPPTINSSINEDAWEQTPVSIQYTLYPA